MDKAKFERELFKTTSPVDLLEFVKKHDYHTTQKFIKISLKHPFTKAVLYNKLFLPNTIEKLNSARILPNSKNFEGELAWIVFSILSFNDKIKSFLKYEAQIEELILKNELEKALELLDVIDEKISYSFWSIELRFSIEERLNGSERNWFILNKINQTKLNNQVLLFSHFFSKKAENDISLLQYKREIDSLFARAESEYSEYLHYQLGYNFINKELNFADILYHENSTSIIDKYLLLLNVLTDLIVYDEKKPLIKIIVSDFLKLNINDSRLFRLNEYNNLSVSTFNDFNVEILEFMDLYSKGNYLEVINLTDNLILKYPYSIEIYEIYISSLLHLNIEFRKTNSSSFIDDILHNLFEIYKKGNNYLGAKEVLLKFSLSFSKINFFNQLFSLTSVLTNISVKNSIELKYFICSRNSNPQIIFLSKIDSNTFFENQNLNKYLTLKINQYIRTGEQNHIDNLIEIPELKKQIYKIRSNNFKLIENNIDELLEVRKKNNNPHIKDELGLYIFNYYYKTSKIDLLISFVIDVYFENRFLIERFNRQLIVDYIFENNYEIGDFNIDFPIFFHIHKLDSFYLYSALESYLNSIKYNKPSEIETTQKDIKLIFLLSKVCTTEVLNNFYLIYENDDEVIEERINILKKLITIDSENESIYFEEIETLLRNQKINKTIKTFNDGRISLNFERIKEDKEYNILNNYNRFIKFKNISDKNDYNLVDINDILTLLIKESANEQNKVQDASFLSFKSLFIEIVEQFLFSQEHGLDGDLSTRFRHGELENSMRSVFQALSLIANKGKSDEYNEISNWNDFFEEKNIEDNIRTKFQIAIKEFSKNIDDYISLINNELIQIISNRHQSKKKGVFNYNFSDEYLWIVYKGLSTNIESYDDFINSMFEILELYTEQLLCKTSDDFKTKVNCQFQAFINELHDKLESFISEKTELKLEVSSRINILKSNLEAELYNISNWFKINKTSANTDLDIETIVKTALELVNLYKEKPVTPTLNLNVKSNFIRGLYYIDIFKILIENSIIHSEVNIEELGLKIDVNNEFTKKEINNSEEFISKVTISIENNLNSSLDICKLNETLTNIKSNWGSDLSLVNKERGSGFQKIGRRLKYDIDVLNSTMKYKIENHKLKIIIEIINEYTNDEI